MRAIVIPLSIVRRKLKHLLKQKRGNECDCLTPIENIHNIIVKVFKVTTIIARGVDNKEFIAEYRLIHELSQVMIAKDLKLVIGLIMTLNSKDMRAYEPPYSDALVIQFKITTIMEFLIISGAYLKKLQYKEELEDVGIPIIWFGRQAAHPLGTKKPSV
ncbi:LOW QUALITY PROTEIN: hypothetical protein Cgig2_000944 [Carnegiea gigantea]|uniref:Uncharacterized protein n=1 Tax=Carnegiea gigantea TaxID=171969 RepID=A0A9Q1JML4_9CARY|nr:LOW QUALITY PROTEIN: hypothetical protein Cgig2_000944 [Carnegiea gigantea]